MRQLEHATLWQIITYELMSCLSMQKLFTLLTLLCLQARYSLDCSPDEVHLGQNCLHKLWGMFTYACMYKHACYHMVRAGTMASERCI